MPERILLAVVALVVAAGFAAALTAARAEDRLNALQFSPPQLSAADLRPARAVLGHLPALDLDEAGRRDVLHGRAVEAAARRGSGTDVALLWDGELVAVAREEEGLLKPAVVLGTP